MEYVRSALFVFDEQAESLVEKVIENAFGAEIETVAIADFLSDPGSHAAPGAHLVVAAALEKIKFVLEFAETSDCSVGIIPLSHQKRTASYLDLPTDFNSALDLALQKIEQRSDLLRCNGHIMLFKAVVGWVPALDAERDMGFWRALFISMRKVVRLRLHRYRITTASGKTVTTGASGCILTQYHIGDMVSSLISDQSSLADSAVSVVVTSPFSIVEYLKFLFQIFLPGLKERKSLNGVGFLKSHSLHIETDIELPVLVDSHIKLTTPVSCVCSPGALRINFGEKLLEGHQNISTKEAIRVANLPHEKEVANLVGRHIPFFSYASEERFRDLFVSLRADSRINGIYVVLMLISTLLAAVGLYLDSAAVIIGAMLLAPLMTPIVSLSMGVLRGDTPLQKNSIYKILLGVGIALLASSAFSLLFPHKPMTGEIAARINPTLLDLAVAVLSGIAAAYSKSYREIIQNLAGVAIAVALVPPLAVAGIGIGSLNMNIFSQAFLLFLTNLTGIILSATLTFRILGFSPVVQARRGFVLISLMLLVIAVPLYLAYDDIVDNYTFQQRIAKDRFMVNGKYVLIRRAELGRRSNRRLLRMDLLAREPLDRSDLTRLKEKVQLYFEEDMLVETSIRYVL